MAKLKKSIRVPTSLNTNRIESKLWKESKYIYSFIVHLNYMAAHLLANLGWVDFDLCCSTLCLGLPGLMGNWQKWLSMCARWCNIQNQSQPNPGSPGDGQNCIRLHYCIRYWVLLHFLARLTMEMIAGTGVRVPTWTISRIPGNCPARAAAKLAL